MAIDPYSPPESNITTLAAEKGTNADRAKVLGAAEGQRYANLLIVVSMLLMGLATSGGASPLIMLPLQLVYIVAMAIVIFRSMRATSGTGVAVIVTLFAWVPLLNLVFLLIISSRATKLLKANGFSVGLLGADLTKVRAWALQRNA